MLILWRLDLVWFGRRLPATRGIVIHVFEFLVCDGDVFVGVVVGGVVGVDDGVLLVTVFSGELFVKYAEVLELEVEFVWELAVAVAVEDDAGFASVALVGSDYFEVVPVDGVDGEEEVIVVGVGDVDAEDYLQVFMFPLFDDAIFWDFLFIVKV